MMYVFLEYKIMYVRCIRKIFAFLQGNLYLCSVKTFKHYTPMALVETTIIRFKNCLSQREIEFFRGAIIELASMRDATLFHNHTDEGFRYDYPMIQYKNLQGRTALVGVNQGASELLWLRPYLNRELNIGIKRIPFEVISVENTETQIGVMPAMMSYTLTDWLPLNQKNDRQFHSSSDESMRIALLESILSDSIFSFYKDLGYTPETKVLCKIERRSPIEKVLYKGVEMRTIDIDFLTNALLPQYIGIGKGSSIGHGIVFTR